MTKSRKRMLLSSIAMLLVALVALGSATYAWFSVSKTVTANNINVKAIAAAGLEISRTSATTGYDTTVSFSDTSASIKPVSWNTTGNGFIPDGNIASGGEAPFSGSKWTDTGVTPGASTGSNNYFAVYQVWIRSASDGANRAAHTVSADVTIAGDNQTFARARLVDSTTAANSKNYWDTTAGSATAVKATTGTTDSVSYLASGTATGVTGTDAVTGAAATDAGKPYLLIVWFDGQDSDCLDTAKDKNATFTVNFTATDM